MHLLSQLFVWRLNIHRVSNSNNLILRFGFSIETIGQSIEFWKKAIDVSARRRETKKESRYWKILTIQFMKKEDFPLKTIFKIRLKAFSPGSLILPYPENIKKKQPLVWLPLRSAPSSQWKEKRSFFIWAAFFFCSGAHLHSLRFIWCIGYNM